MLFITFCSFILTIWASCQAQLVTQEQIAGAIIYPGEQAEHKLADLAYADYYYALALSYLEPTDKKGYMTLERLDLALRRALGDIREAAYIQEPSARKAAIFKAFFNLQAAFERAPKKQIPVND